MSEEHSGPYCIAISKYLSGFVQASQQFFNFKQLAIQWLRGAGWNYVKGVELAPEETTPEQADFRTVVLKARLAAVEEVA